MENTENSEHCKELDDGTANDGRKKVLPIEMTCRQLVEELFVESRENHGNDARFHAKRDAEESGYQHSADEV